MKINRYREIEGERERERERERKREKECVCVCQRVMDMLIDGLQNTHKPTYIHLNGKMCNNAVYIAHCKVDKLRNVQKKTW